MRALVTGATGFVGRRLLTKLERAVVLSRDAAKAEKELSAFGVKAYSWKPEVELPPAGAKPFQGIDAIFHLAGESVAGRWNEAKKARIRNSRERGTRHLVEALRLLQHKPRVLVSASAVGYYGNRGAEEIDETFPAASDFLAEVCVAWEREARMAEELGIRVVPIRIGLVLGKGGGALDKMKLPFQAGLGAPLGTGEQYMPWIHVDDLVEMLLFAAREPITGPLNGTAPHPVTNREFTQTLARALGRPTFMPPVPPFALRLMLGEFADALLASQRVIPRAALATGFAFQYRELEPALRNVV
jgi:uncharacterized protein (TIGR01777 family)